MGRPYILVEDVQFTPSTSEMEDAVPQKGTLKVTGVIRGAPLSADRLVYLRNWGDFAIGRIIAAPRRPRGPQGDGSMDVEDKVLSEPGPERDDLIEVNEVDDMGNEQTWPTEEEMREKDSDVMEGDVPDAPEGTTPKAVRRVPKGTSAYQAAWLLEDEEVDSEENWSDASDDEGGEAGSTKTGLRFENMSVDGEDSNKDAEVEEQEEYEDVAEEEQNSKAVAFEDMDMEEEKRQ
jgi:pre-rRNA-processing protein TSR1